MAAAEARSERPADRAALFLRAVAEDAELVAVAVGAVEIDRAVASEQYERAARLRDRLHTLAEEGSS